MKKIIIYLRASREEQNPQNQLRDILNLKPQDYQILEEKKSAFKETTIREEFEKIKKLIEQKQITDLYVWDWDRIYRNRKKLKSFFALCKQQGVRVHSYRQQWLEKFHNQDFPPGMEFIKEMVYGIFVELLGYMAEDESKKKSERVKAAIRIDNGIVRSYKGNKWGRPRLSKVNTQIIELYNQGVPIRKIAEQVHYWDKNKHKKTVSIGYVHKTITNFKEGKSSQMDQR